MIPVGAVLPAVDAHSGEQIGFWRCVEESELGVWVWVGPEVRLVPSGGLEPPSPESKAGILPLDDKGMVLAAGIEPASPD